MFSVSLVVPGVTHRGVTLVIWGQIICPGTSMLVTFYLIWFLVFVSKPEVFTAYGSMFRDHSWQCLRNSMQFQTDQLCARQSLNLFFFSSLNLFYYLFGPSMFLFCLVLPLGFMGHTDCVPGLSPALSVVTAGRVGGTIYSTEVDQRKTHSLPIVLSP